MPTLRRHRRPRRSKARRNQPLNMYCRDRRRNLEEFIPKADSDFAFTSANFVLNLKDQPEIFLVTKEQIAEVEQAVTQFRHALTKLLIARRTDKGSASLTREKNNARALAVERVSELANLIRANRKVPIKMKKVLRIKVRPEKPGKRPCPQSPPSLLFMGSGDGVAGGVSVGVGSGSGFHVLKFLDFNQSVAITPSSEVGKVRRKKPDGAVRVELYFDMIPVGEPVPMLPNERGWPKYIQSYTRSPIEVPFPLPSEPMLIVYWAKWAGSDGETSRWSKPCIARVEGWTSAARPSLPAQSANLPASQSMQHFSGVQTKYVYVQTPIAGELPGAQPMPDPVRQMLSGHLLESEAELMPLRKQLEEGRCG